MRQLPYLYILFFLTLSLSAETLLVDTVSTVPISDLEDNRLNQIRFMENGIIDGCFEKGWMVFSSLSIVAEISDGIEIVLSDARKIGADLLIRIQALPEDGKMLYQVYSVSSKDMILSGEWVSDEIQPDSRHLADWFYESGQKTLETLMVQ